MADQKPNQREQPTPPKVDRPTIRPKTNKI